MNEIKEIVDVIVNTLMDLGPIAGFFLIILESIFPVLPLGVFIGFNMLSFGNIGGFILSYISALIGCISSFLVFRYLIRDKYTKVIKKKNLKKLEDINKNITNMNFKILVLLITCPFTPAFLINIAAGLSKMNIKKYIPALLIGKLFIIYFWGYIGTGLIKSIENPIILIKIFVIMLLGYAISYVISKIAKI